MSASAYSSGIGANISCSSFSISSSVFVDASSSAVRGGSHDAINRWLLARARFALLNIISASLVVAGMMTGKRVLGVDRAAAPLRASISAANHGSASVDPGLGISTAADRTEHRWDDLDHLEHLSIRQSLCLCLSTCSGLHAAGHLPVPSEQSE